MLGHPSCVVGTAAKERVLSFQLKAHRSTGQLHTPGGHHLAVSPAHVVQHNIYTPSPSQPLQSPAPISTSPTATVAVSLSVVEKEVGARVPAGLQLPPGRRCGDYGSPGRLRVVLC